MSPTMHLKQLSYYMFGLVDIHYTAQMLTSQTLFYYHCVFKR